MEGLKRPPGSVLDKILQGFAGLRDLLGFPLQPFPPFGRIHRLQDLADSRVGEGKFGKPRFRAPKRRTLAGGADNPPFDPLKVISRFGVNPMATIQTTVEGWLEAEKFQKMVLHERNHVISQRGRIVEFPQKPLKRGKKGGRHRLFLQKREDHLGKITGGGKFGEIATNPLRQQKKIGRIEPGQIGFPFMVQNFQLVEKIQPPTKALG